MSAKSSIEWTDATWNPVRGCVKVSPGCANCYAETFAERFRGVASHPYEQGFDLRLVPEKLGEPQRWKSAKRVFVNSMSDLFLEGVPDDYIAEVWRTIATIRRHTYQVLTKRAARMQALVPRLVATFGVLPNVWLGVSIENQHFADERIPLLLQTPAAVRFISAEPLLGPVNVEPWLGYRCRRCKSLQTSCECTFGSDAAADRANFRGLDWVIVGGESGPGARMFNVAWARSIIQQCKSAGVACFVKQLGAYVLACDGDSGNWNLRDKKGGDPQEWPEDLRIREFPCDRELSAGEASDALGSFVQSKLAEKR